MFEGVVSIHGNKHLKDLCQFILKLVAASRTGIAQVLVRRITFKCNIHMLCNSFTDGQVEIIANRKLLAEVRAEWHLMKVTETFDKSVSS